MSFSLNSLLLVDWNINVPSGVPKKETLLINVKLFRFHMAYHNSPISLLCSWRYYISQLSTLQWMMYEQKNVLDRQLRHSTRRPWAWVRKCTITLNHWGFKYWWNFPLSYHANHVHAKIKNGTKERNKNVPKVSIDLVSVHNREKIHLISAYIFLFFFLFKSYLISFLTWGLCTALQSDQIGQL